MPWILLTVTVGVVLAIGATIFAVRSGRTERPEPTANELVALGTVFLAVGAGTIPTLGIGMIGMMGVGIAFLVMGTRRRNTE